jgi:very-short-patch-repair endonuclease
MLLWAFASVKRRKSPPGWERPPRFEQMTLDNQRILKRKSKNKNREDHLVTFVSDDDQYEEDVDEDNGSNSSWSATKRLFDAAAVALCRGEGAAAIQSLNNDTSMLKRCTWSELSNFAWSFAARGAYGTKESDAMMNFLAREATRRIYFAMRAPPTLTGGMKNKYCKLLPRDVIQIAWALGIMDSDNASNGNAIIHLVDAINEYWVDNKSNESFRSLSCLRGSDLVQLSVALAHGRLDNLSVLKSLFSAPELSILLWVQARLNLSKSQGSVFGEFPSAACQVILNQIGKDKTDVALDKIGLRSQEQANLAWSLTVLNQFDENVTVLLQHVFQASASQPDGTIQLEHAHQLWQAFFILRDDLPAAVNSVPPKFSKYLERKWNNEKDRTKKSSSRHKAISKTLELLDIAHENEYQEDVDVAIALSETTSFTSQAQMPMSSVEGGSEHHKVAVEFDGPYHFTVMASTGDELAQIENGAKIRPRVLGHTALKYKMLKKKGWTVIRLPYYEWDKIPHWASMERQRYLQRCLKTHQEIQFSEVDVSQYEALPQTRHSRFD